jgi:hypothetical protein
MATTLLAAVLCASCHSPTAPTSTSVAAQPVGSVHYCFATADLRIDLDLSANGTYFASMDCWARVTEESGVWSMEGANVDLKCRSGGLQMPIRRLAPTHQAPGGTLQVVEPDSWVGLGVVFSKI